MSKFYPILACCLICIVGPATAQTTFPISVHTAFLHLDRADSANGALVIDLASLSLTPGSTIALECVGDWDAGPGGDAQSNLLAIFSSNSTLLDRALLHRVPGALDAGLHNYSGGTYPNNEPTDIPEDFVVGRPGITVTVPAGAAKLFVSAADICYFDNEDPDGDLGVKVTLISAASVPANGLSASSHLFPAKPNPFHAETSIEFRLAHAGPARLSIHDAGGRRVRALVEGDVSRGSHVLKWDGRDSTGRRLPAGNYYARFNDGSGAEATRMVLVR